MSGLGLAGGFGAAAGAQSLDDLLKQKFVEQIQKAKLAEDQRQADMQNTVATRQLGQGDRRLDQDASQFGVTSGLAQRKQGFDETVYAEGAPQRKANVEHTTAETGDITGRPAARLLAEGFADRTAANLANKQMELERLRGANAVATAQTRQRSRIQKTPGVNAAGKPVIKFIDIDTGEVVHEELAPPTIGQQNALSPDQIETNAAAHAKGAAAGKKAGGGGGLVNDLISGAFGGSAPAPAVSHTPTAATGQIQARDPQGGIHKAAAGTKLPPGWTLVPQAK